MARTFNGQLDKEVNGNSLKIISNPKFNEKYDNIYEAIKL